LAFGAFVQGVDLLFQMVLLIDQIFHRALQVGCKLIRGNHNNFFMKKYGSGFKNERNYY